jgi:hypothetical protein
MSIRNGEFVVQGKFMLQILGLLADQ